MGNGWEAEPVAFSLTIVAKDCAMPEVSVAILAGESDGAACEEADII